MPELVVDTHWLFAGRFVVYVLGFVIIYGAVVDWLTTRKQPHHPFVSYQIMAITGAIGVMLSSPARFEVIRRLFNYHPSNTEVNVLLFMGLVSIYMCFIAAQVTRLWYRGATKRKMALAALTSLLGILILAGIGVGLDVRFQ